MYLEKNIYNLLNQTSWLLCWYIADLAANTCLGEEKKNKADESVSASIRLRGKSSIEMYFRMIETEARL
jgi:hypothetical protein